MWPFNKSPIQLMKEREQAEFIENMRCMALEVSDGRMTNHGLSVYGAHKLYASGREPSPVEWRVLLDDGTFMNYYDWVKVNYPAEEK